MQHSELTEWSLFSLPPSDEQSAFYTSSVFIWLCFFGGKFLWDCLQFIFILITLLGRYKWHKSQNVWIQHLNMDVILSPPPPKKKVCLCVFISLTGQGFFNYMIWDSRISTSCWRTLQEDSDCCGIESTSSRLDIERLLWPEFAMILNKIIKNGPKF